MDVPKNFFYTRDHLWIYPEGNRSRIGITDYSQGELGEIVFIDLPEIDDEIEMAAPFGIIESETAVSDLTAPVSGDIVEVNLDLIENPDVVNEDPYGEGWLISVQMHDSDQIDTLLKPEEYEDYIAGLGDEDEEEE
ncbi:glycine cleavage system protein GcvH [bacterium]|nr:MAG: glycine cleavage system protein GcvH [bacterium]